jgi:hypothetical protein
MYKFQGLQGMHCIFAYGHPVILTSITKEHGIFMQLKEHQGSWNMAVGKLWK